MPRQIRAGELVWFVYIHFAKFDKAKGRAQQFHPQSPFDRVITGSSIVEVSKNHIAFLLIG
jgi:hypothetical protein